jgi:hypothetical protein
MRLAGLPKKGQGGGIGDKKREKDYSSFSGQTETPSAFERQDGVKTGFSTPAFFCFR